MTLSQSVKIVFADGGGYRVSLLDDEREDFAQPQNNFDCADIPAVVAWVEANLGVSA